MAATPTTPVAVITGGASGFGLALAEHCAATGMDVALLDIDGERVRTAAAELADAHGVRAVGHRVDVSSRADVEGAASTIRADLGRCDLLWVDAVDVSEDDLNAMLASRPISEADITTAEDAAQQAFSGVLAGEPYVITHGDLAEPVAKHHAAIERALEQLTLRRSSG